MAIGMSTYETLGPSHGIHTLNVTQQILAETAFEMWKESDFSLQTRDSTPTTPGNPHLGQNAQKWATFWKPNHIPTFMKPYFWFGNGSWGYPVAKDEPEKL